MNTQIRYSNNVLVKVHVSQSKQEKQYQGATKRHHASRRSSPQKSAPSLAKKIKKAVRRAFSRNFRNNNRDPKKSQRCFCDDSAATCHTTATEHDTSFHDETDDVSFINNTDGFFRLPCLSFPVLHPYEPNSWSIYIIEGGGSGAGDNFMFRVVKNGSRGGGAAGAMYLQGNEILEFIRSWHDRPCGGSDPCDEDDNVLFYVFSNVKHAPAIYDKWDIRYALRVLFQQQRRQRHHRSYCHQQSVKEQTARATKKHASHHHVVVTTTQNMNKRLHQTMRSDRQRRPGRGRHQMPQKHGMIASNYGTREVTKR